MSGSQSLQNDTISPDGIMPALNDHYQRSVREWEKRYIETLDRRGVMMCAMARLVRPVLRLFRFFQAVYEETSQYSEAAKSNEGVPVWLQLWHQLSIGLCTHLPPSAYYQFMLYRDENRTQAAYYIHHLQMHTLVNEPVYTVDSREADILKDKSLFYKHCRRHVLDTIPVLAVIDADQVDAKAWEKERPLPCKDLFSKPVDGGQGMGAKRWVYTGGKQYRGEENQLVNQEGLLEELTQQSRNDGRPIILQERCQNHTVLNDWVGSTLCAARLVTGRKPNGPTELLTAMIGLPVGEAPAGNFIPEYDSLGTAIDRKGQLGTARYKRPDRVMNTYTKHPVTSQRIDGFQLPDWDDAVSLVIEAHETLQGIPFIGWDVAFTDQGPLLIEGNQGFGAESLQVASGIPLGKTKFAQYYFEYIVQERE